MSPEHPLPRGPSSAADRFGRFARHYVDSPSHASGADLDLHVEWAQPRASWTVLDVATGGAHTALAFAPHVRRVVACDLSPGMLRAARRHAEERGVTNIEFVLGDACDLPFAPRSFDVVTCRSAAHHFTSVDDFVREAKRVLREGGLLIVQDQKAPDDPEAAEYVNGFERRRDPSHARALSEEAWRRALAGAGLSLERSAELVKRHDLEDWAVRQGQGPSDIADLRTMLDDAPRTAQAWLDPRRTGGSGVSFAIHHMIVSARKEGSS